jgi:glycosyltransferase involved in cell wall biosynthesis
MPVSYNIAVILPNTKLFGGVRRFFELGEIFIAMGHQMTVFTDDAAPPTWCNFSGRMDSIVNLKKHDLDCLFITEPVFLQQLVNANARLKIFYHVGPRASLKEVLKHKEIMVFANSTNMFIRDKKRYGIEAVKALGGVHIPTHPKEIRPTQSPFLIMCYGRLSRKGKGTGIVVKAAEKMYKSGRNVKLLLFDTPLDDKGEKLIQAFNPKVPFEFILNHPVAENEQLFKRTDVFVAVEKKGGWSNTAAEALAAGIPLVASNTGTNDFLIDGITGIKVWRHSWFVKRALIKLMDNIQLQQTLAFNGRKKMESLSWNALAQNIIGIIKNKLPSQNE